MDDNLRKNAAATSRNIFFGSLILMLFFILAAKLSQRQAVKLSGLPLPPLSCKWDGKPLTGAELGGKNVLLYFYKSSVDISKAMLSRSLQLQNSLKQKDFIIVLITDETSKIKNRPENMYICLGDGKNRRAYLNGSYATYYLADRLSIIRHVGQLNSEADGKMESLAAMLP